MEDCKRGGDAGFLQLGQQAVVESFVGFGIALEDVVLDHALGHRVGFGFLLIEDARQQFFTLLGLVIIAFQPRDDGFLLLIQILVQLLDLRLQP